MNRNKPPSHQIVNFLIHQFMFSESYASIVMCCQKRWTLFLKISRVALGFLRNCDLLLFVGLLFPMLTHMLHFYFPPWEARLSFHVRLQLAAFLELSLFLAQSHIVASHLLPRVERSSFLQPLSLVFTADVHGRRQRRRMFQQHVRR